MSYDKAIRRGRRRLAALAIAVVAVTSGCGDEGDDLAPREPEVGEEDVEIVPGEDGPVD